MIDEFSMPLLLWLHYSFCGGDMFVMQMMFSVNVMNTKVVDNLLILVVQRFHDLRPDGLGVIDFRNLLLGFCMSSREI